MLRRRITPLQAIGINMGMMVGVGPFITIPDFLKTLGGPQAMVGWVVGALIAMADGLVWSELAAAFPGSGGTLHFYDAVYRNSAWGRLLKFLFVWQFLFSGPLELASGAIGIGRYSAFLWHGLRQPVLRLPGGMVVDGMQLVAALAVLGLVALAYRRIEVAGRLMLVLWGGMLVTVGCIIVAGLTRFDAALLTDLPPEAGSIDGRFAFQLGAAVAIALYDYLGYYQVCYLGDEVVEPARTLPRAILVSAAVVAAIYLVMNVSILGVLPWREAMASEHIASDFMLRRFGPAAATGITALILWTAAASLFAGILSYSRIPYAAARTGLFFDAFGATHPRGQFPHRSLLVIGAASLLGCLFPLTVVIEALLTSRILIQFVGQIATVFFIRSRPELRSRLSFRMPLFPVPALIALAGWMFVFGTTRLETIAYGVASLAAGGLAYAFWSRSRSHEPGRAGRDRVG
ncbi:MAG: amino acid permease [Isosphaeraceae bacterium]|jgi:amino acid transporter|nr:MAG: amino acid permease [Isosphaeraceae bacterium]